MWSGTKRDPKSKKARKREQGEAENISTSGTQVVEGSTTMDGAWSSSYLGLWGNGNRLCLYGGGRWPTVSSGAVTLARTGGEKACGTYGAKMVDREKEVVECLRRKKISGEVKRHVLLMVRWPRLRGACVDTGFGPRSTSKWRGAVRAHGAEKARRCTVKRSGRATGGRMAEGGPR